MISIRSAALFLALASTVSSAQTRYDVVDLGTLAMQSNAFAINNFNQAVGTSVASNFYFSATGFGPGGAWAYGPFAGFRNTAATAINNSGAVYGVGFNLGSLSPVALRLDGSAPISLGSFTPVAARDDGTLVGSAPTNSNGLYYESACMYSGGTLTLLPSLGGPFSQAFAIDIQGRIVGSSSLATGPDPKPTLWINGSPINLLTLGGSRGQAKDINNTGAIVGFSENGTGLARATRWTINSSGQVLSRTDLSSPFPTRTAFINAINEAGVSVGTSAFHAIRWSADGSSTDLNSFCSPLSGWTLETAAAINDSGVIVGTGSLRGFPRAFMLVPVSCPADFNRDGVLDFFDYLDFVDAFASARNSSDFNLDGVIDFFDYLDFVDAFSRSC